MGDSTTQAEQVKRPRWRLRFGLRTLLITVTLICVLLGSAMLWYRAQEAEYQREGQAAPRLSQYGWITWKQKMPGWLKWAGDPTAFIRVTAIEFRQSVQASEISELFEYLPAIESISFFADPQQFDEAMIQKLSELKALKEIVFWSVREPNDKDIDYAVYHPPVSNKPFQTLRERLPNVNVHSRLPF